VSKNRVSRREFVRKTAAATTAAFAAPTLLARKALGSGPRPAPSERISLGFIGAGWRGNDLVKAFWNFPDVQCVAVCDTFTSRRESTAGAIDAHYEKEAAKGSFKGCTNTVDFRHVLARDDIDAVVIATPDHWHVPIALAAVRTGKDVYVEKPLSIAVTWGQALRKELAKTGAVFQFGTQQRSNARFRLACELARNKRFGPIESIDVWAPGMRAPGWYESLYKDGGSTEPIPVPDDLDYDMWIGPVPMSPYTKDRCTHEGTNHVYDNSLGFIAGWGVHPLDIALWGAAADNLAPIEYEGTGTIPTKGLYDTISDWDVRCRFANGVEMRFMNRKTAEPVVGKYRPFNDHGTTFFGSDGWVSVDRKGLHASDPALLDAKFGDDEIRLYESDNHFRNFLDCVKSRKATISPFESAFQSFVVSQMSDLAIRMKDRIVWDPEKEDLVGNEAGSKRLHRTVRAPWSL